MASRVIPERESCALPRHAFGVLELAKALDVVARFATTTGGAERVRALAPAAERGAVEREAARVRDAALLTEGPAALSVPAFPDLARVFADVRVPGSLLDGAALLGVLDLLRAADAIRRAVARRDDAPALRAEAQELDPVAELAARLARTLDAEGRVQDGASPRLSRIRRDIETTRETIRARLEAKLAALAASGALQENLVTIRGGRYVLPVRASERGRVEGVVHDESATGATLFIEPLALVPLNNRVAELLQAESREVRAILAECTDAVRGTLDALERDAAILAGLDAAFARARYGRAVGGVLPAWSAAGRLRLVAARHPLLLEQIGDRAVPLDLEMPEGTTTLLVSGPNTGGKTVALKTVGLLSLLAQCGVPIPASEGTELPVFTAAYADVGDEQSIEESLSTFSSRLRNVREVLAEANGGSLVLLDEIGTGTDPEEGGALAAAVLKALAARGARTIATTHLGFLIDLASQEAAMENASMAFDAATGRPTYRIVSGVPGKSHALEVARGLGIDAAVIEEARRLLPEGARRSRDLLAELTARLAEVRALQAALAEREGRAVEREREWTERCGALAREERELLRRAAADARTLVARAETEAEAALAELRAIRRASRRAPTAAPREADGALDAARAQARRLRDARREVERRADDAPAAETPGRVPERLDAGTPVIVAPYGRRAQVISAPDGAGRVEVLVGSVRMTLPAASLRAVEEPPAEPGARAVLGVTLPAAREVGFEIDLRGLRADEAVELVDRHIDAASVARLPSVRIVHGVGTGVLRREIGAFLERDERVKSFRRGEWGEGELGVTIVQLH